MLAVCPPGRPDHRQGRPERAGDAAADRGRHQTAGTGQSRLEQRYADLTRKDQLMDNSFCSQKYFYYIIAYKIKQLYFCTYY